MGTSGPNEHKVVIFRQGDKAKVWPPYLVVGPEDYITFSTIGLSVEITLPNRYAFKELDPGYTYAVGELKWKSVEATSRRVGLVRVNRDSNYTVRMESHAKAMSSLRDSDDRMMFEGAMVFNQTQVYTYTVFCEEINNLAEANSSPVIIVEPPPPRYP